MQEMIEHSKISKRERQRQAAMSVRSFCESVSIGRTRFYQEVKAGRLRVRKVGRRTIVTAADADAWLSNLPALHGEFDEAAS
jgi:hypothetical protein